MPVTEPHHLTFTTQTTTSYLILILTIALSYAANQAETMPDTQLYEGRRLQMLMNPKLHVAKESKPNRAPKATNITQPGIILLSCSDVPTTLQPLPIFIVYS